MERLEAIKQIGRKWTYSHLFIGRQGRTYRQLIEVITLAKYGNRLKLFDITQGKIYDLSFTEINIRVMRYSSIEILERLNENEMETMRLLYG